MPETVQTEVVRLLNVTGNFDEAVALTLAEPPTERLGWATKLIVWLGSILKLAVALFPAAMITVQLELVPLHAPLQPVKVLPLAGVAVSVTVEPAARLAAQVPEVVLALLVQLRLPGLLISAPEPLPVALSVSAKVPRDCPPRTRRTWLTK